MKEVIVEVRTPDGTKQVMTVEKGNTGEIIIDNSVDIGGTHIERFTTITVRGVR